MAGGGGIGDGRGLGDLEAQCAHRQRRTRQQGAQFDLEAHRGQALSGQVDRDLPAVRQGVGRLAQQAEQCAHHGQVQFGAAARGLQRRHEPGRRHDLAPLVQQPAQHFAGERTRIGVVRVLQLADRLEVQDDTLVAETGQRLGRVVQLAVLGLAQMAVGRIVVARSQLAVVARLEGQVRGGHHRAVHHPRMRTVECGDAQVGQQADRPAADIDLGVLDARDHALPQVRIARVLGQQRELPGAHIVGFHQILQTACSGVHRLCLGIQPEAGHQRVGLIEQQVAQLGTRQGARDALAQGLEVGQAGDLIPQRLGRQALGQFLAIPMRQPQVQHHQQQDVELEGDVQQIEEADRTVRILGRAGHHAHQHQQRCRESRHRPVGRQAQHGPTQHQQQRETVIHQYQLRVCPAGPEHLPDKHGCPHADRQSGCQHDKPQPVRRIRRPRHGMAPFAPRHHQRQGYHGHAELLGEEHLEDRAHRQVGCGQHDDA